MWLQQVGSQDNKRQKPVGNGTGEVTLQQLSGGTSLETQQVDGQCTVMTVLRKENKKVEVSVLTPLWKWKTELSNWNNIRGKAKYLRSVDQKSHPHCLNDVCEQRSTSGEVTCKLSWFMEEFPSSAVTFNYTPACSPKCPDNQTCISCKHTTP